MIVSNARIRKIIKEALLREYAAYFGQEYVEFKKRFESGEHPVTIANEILEPIGRGSTRIVFGFRDNQTAVIKIANADESVVTNDWTNVQGFSKKHMLDSNMWEADLKLQQVFPDVFPRTFEVAPDYSWILAEKVRVIGRGELLEKLNLGDEKIPTGFLGKIQFKAIIELAVEYYKDPDSIARKLIGEGATDTYVDSQAKTINDPKTFRLRPKEEKGIVMPASRQTEKLARRLKKVLSTSHNRKMFNAIAKLNIPTREFSAKNVGISNISNKLMMLDASLWTEYKSIY